MGMIQNSNSPEINYDASNFIRGKSLLNLSIEEIQRCLTVSPRIDERPNYMENRRNNQNTNVNNNNGFNNISKSVNNAMINPFSNDNNYNNSFNNSSNNGFNTGYNNNLSASVNYASNPYLKNKIDNSIPDPFLCEQKNNYRNGNHDDHSSLNPYNVGNNNIENPFK